MKTPIIFSYGEDSSVDFSQTLEYETWWNAQTEKWDSLLVQNLQTNGTPLTVVNSFGSEPLNMNRTVFEQILSGHIMLDSSLV